MLSDRGDDLSAGLGDVDDRLLTADTGDGGLAVALGSVRVLGHGRGCFTDSGDRVSSLMRLLSSLEERR